MIEIILVGRIMYERANGMLARGIKCGDFLDCIIMRRVIANINIEGPCGHNARLAVDQAAVQKEKMKVTSNADFTLKDFFAKK